ASAARVDHGPRRQRAGSDRLLCHRLSNRRTPQTPCRFCKVQHRQLQSHRARHAARGTALARCRRDHRQRVHQVAGGADSACCPGGRALQRFCEGLIAMNLESIVAIDVHTHAWKSALQLNDTPSESQQAMGRYFRYQPQHQTVPEMAQMYRKLKMAFVVFTVDGPLEERKITNEEIAELAHKNSDVAIPFASINPR